MSSFINRYLLAIGSARSESQLARLWQHQVTWKDKHQILVCNHDEATEDKYKFLGTHGPGADSGCSAEARKGFLGRSYLS